MVKSPAYIDIVALLRTNGMSFKKNSTKEWSKITFLGYSTIYDTNV